MSLKIKELYVDLQEDKILHGINLDIQTGEFISLLGASGCGKTTLLKSIAGLLEVQSGEIEMDGNVLNDILPEKRGTIIVFQDLRLFPHMTVEKNIAFAMQLKGVPKAEQKRKVQQLLESVQLSGYEHRKIQQMSGGQRQRVALARALAAEPKVLLLDEPFSGLDEKLRVEMGELVKKLHKEWKLTTILVTHDKREALQMSDRIALMSEGKVLQYASPEEIFYHPKTKAVADYFGKANYIDGSVKDGQFTSKLGTWKAQVADGEYLAMVRPFSIVVGEVGDLEVKQVEFQGESVLVTLETKTGEILANLSGSDYKKLALKVGNKVSIQVNQDEVVYFET